MRKLLLIGLVALGVACQKDYYLEDLETANARIERLQDQLNDVSLELQQSIADNNTKAEELIVLETKILDLNSDIEQLISLNLYKDGQIEGLLEKIDVLSIEIESLNSQIADLQNQLADALEQTELDVELITNLNNQITELENREPEVIIEYIEVIETVYSHSVTQGATVYVDTPTQFDASNSTLEELEAEIKRLQDLVDNYPTPPVDISAYKPTGMFIDGRYTGPDHRLYSDNTNTLSTGDLVIIGDDPTEYTVSDIWNQNGWTIIILSGDLKWNGGDASTVLALDGLQIKKKD